MKEELKQAQQSLAAKTKEFENAINKLQKGLNEKTREAAQFEEENSNLASQARELEGKCEQTEVQFVESKQKLAEETNKVTQLSKESNKTQAQLEEKKKEIGELKDQVTQLTAQSNQLEGQLNDARQDLTNKIDEITQLENENNNLKTKLHKSENKSKELERNLQKQSESKNEELNEKFLKARIYSKEQGNYASVSFVLSGAFAVGASLTMLHLVICISLAVAALTFLAVGCYCSYNANTALNNVEVGQIGNDASHSVV